MSPKRLTLLGSLMLFGTVLLFTSCSGDTEHAELKPTISGVTFNGIGIGDPISKLLERGFVQDVLTNWYEWNGKFAEGDYEIDLKVLDGSVEKIEIKVHMGEEFIEAFELKHGEAHHHSGEDGTYFGSERKWRTDNGILNLKLQTWVYGEIVTEKWENYMAEARAKDSARMKEKAAKEAKERATKNLNDL